MNLTFEEIAIMVYLLEKAVDSDKNSRELLKIKTLLTKMQTLYAEIDKTLNGGRVM